MAREQFKVNKEGNYATLSTLTLSDNHAQPSNLCALCATFQIRGVPEVPDEECVLFSWASYHKLRQEYKDMCPDFPNMKKRATEGCDFCAFLRNSLLWQYEKLGSGSGCKNEPVQVILSAWMIEMVEDESALSMFRSRGPHVVQVLVQKTDESRHSKILTFEMTFQISKGTCASADNNQGKEQL